MIDFPLPTYKEGEYEAFNSGGVERETAELLYSFVRILKPHAILDLGTHKGISASYMAMGCRDNNEGSVFTVEFDSQHWNDEDMLWSKLQLRGLIYRYKMSVEEYLRRLKDDPSFESSHSYQLMLIDTEPSDRFSQLVEFYPFLSPGGYVFLHDLHRHMGQEGRINPDHPEMENWPWGTLSDQIKNWLKDRELVPFYFPTPRGLTGFYKNDPRDYKII